MYFDINLTTKTKKLAKLLVTLNILRRVHRIQGERYRVFPSYTKFRKFSRLFKSYTRVNGRIRLTVRALRILNINTPHSYYVIETNRGVMTHKDALRSRVGGLLLMIIF